MEKLTTKQLAEVEQIGGMIARGEGDAVITGRWASFLETLSHVTFIDINALVQFVLRQAYMESLDDLQYYADKVRYFNVTKANSWDSPATMPEDQQRANVDLQNALQKQQQLLQMWANFNKVLHDTASATIRNLK
jgi:hypothetical protein